MLLSMVGFKFVKTYLYSWKLFCFALKEEYKRLESVGDKLAEIDSLIDWKTFRIILESMYISKTVSEGRPETDVIVMFKMLVLQQWQELSDFELEKQCIDRISFRKLLVFLEYVPYSTTVWLFRERISENFKENMGKVAKPTLCSGFTDKAG